MNSVENDAWSIGLDLGTGSCKAVVVDAALQPRAMGASSYGSGSRGTHSASGFEEQDADELVAGLAAACRQAVQAAQRDHPKLMRRPCAGLSVGGTLHSLLALDSQGRPLTGVYTWADLRAVQQAATIKTDARSRELYRRTGCPVHAMYPLYKIAWLQQMHPQIFHKAQRFVSAKEYVLHQLTGEFRLDYAIAAGTGMLDVRSLAWDDEALAIAGIDVGRLSPLGDATDWLPGLTPEAARLLGLAPGTPVALGASDAVNSNLGAGAISAESAVLMIGTSGALRFFSPEPVLDAQARTWCYRVDRNLYLVGGAINNGGLALTWLRDLFLQAAQGTAGLSFDDLLMLAQQSPPGAEGVLCLPLFAGERSPGWNPEARGAFIGLSLRHGPAHVTRALIEGIAYRFRSLDEALHEAGASYQHLRASGGFARSPFWLQLNADVLGRELEIVESGETSALGAATWPLLAAGVLTDIEQVAQHVPIVERVAPHPDATAFYGAIYQRYKSLYDQLK